MTEYNVIIEPSAAEDLIEISDYITRVFSEPTTASKLYFSISDCILSLSNLPNRHKIISDEPYRSQGIRMISVKNYTVFYLVNEEEFSVHIIRVLYNRRDWQSIL